MNECYQLNLDCIAKRWPSFFSRLQQINPNLDAVNVIEGSDSTLLINGIQLTSRHNRAKEAALQVSQLCESEPVVHLYGTGLGDVQQQLLARNSLKKLHVHILNEHVFLLVLQLLEQRFWLEDERVTLQFASDALELQRPLLALPADLELSSDMNYKIKQRLQAEGDLLYNQKHIDAQWQRQSPVLEKNAVFFAKDKLVQQLFTRQEAKKEAYILATGPSLELQFEHLKKRQQSPNKPLFIAVDSALKPLLQQGIIPDFVVTIDIKMTPQRVLALTPPSSVSLVYFPLTNPHLLEAWPGERYLAVTHNELYQPLRESLGVSELFTYGSVIHPALDLAVQMGATKIVFFGADFAFSSEKTHTGWQDDELGLGLEKSFDWTLNGEGQRVKTLRNLQSYLIGVERYIQHHPKVAFFNSSTLGSVIAGCPLAPEFQ